FDASSATPQAIGGTVGPLVVVGGAVVVAVVDVSVVWPAGSSAAPVAAKNPAARSAQRQSPPNTLTFTCVPPSAWPIRHGQDRPPRGGSLEVSEGNSHPNWVIRHPLR